jgi:cytidylate kinase
VAIQEVLLIGGSAGVGKSTVGWEVSVQLNRLQIAHWHLEGDVLDAAWPRPPDDQDGERMTVNTMRAMAGVFAAEGYTRCVHVQTASVIDSHLVTQALGSVRLLGVLLTASEATRIQRLADREIGTDLDRHLASTRRMAERLARESPQWVVRVATDDRTVPEIAQEVIEHSGWHETATPAADSGRTCR